MSELNKVGIVAGLAETVSYKELSTEEKTELVLRVLSFGGIRFMTGFTTIDKAVPSAEILMNRVSFPLSIVKTPPSEQDFNPDAQFLFIQRFETNLISESKSTILRQTKDLLYSLHGIPFLLISDWSSELESEKGRSVRMFKREPVTVLSTEAVASCLKMLNHNILVKLLTDSPDNFQRIIDRLYRLSKTTLNDMEADIEQVRYIHYKLKQAVLMLGV